MIFLSHWKERWFVQDVHLHIWRERERASERERVLPLSKDQNLVA